MLSSGYGLRRAFARRLAAGVGAVFLLAQIGAFYHHAVVEHEYCEEHGELIHAGTSSGSDRAPDPRGGAAGGGEEKDAALESGEAAEAGHGHDHGEHEHCHIQPTTRAEPASACVSPIGEAAARGASLALPESAEAGESEARFELAPKTSPPSARKSA